MHAVYYGSVPLLSSPSIGASMSSRITLPSHAAMVANIAAVLHSATPGQRDAGMSWYADAHSIAAGFAAESGYSVEQCAGVLAAVSPQSGWGRNVTLAARIIRERGATTTGYLRLGLSKASAVLDGADIPTTLHGAKVTAFYAAIATNGKTDTVCIDRHAYCIAVDDRSQTSNIPKLTPSRYAAISAAYVAVAAGTQYTAAQVQAITWTVWRNRYWSAGSFDGHAE